MPVTSNTAPVKRISHRLESLVEDVPPSVRLIATFPALTTLRRYRSYPRCLLGQAQIATTCSPSPDSGRRTTNPSAITPLCDCP
jgi:hypothetical protein